MGCCRIIQRWPHTFFTPAAGWRWPQKATGRSEDLPVARFGVESLRLPHHAAMAPAAAGPVTSRAAAVGRTRPLRAVPGAPAPSGAASASAPGDELRVLLLQLTPVQEPLFTELVAQLVDRCGGKKPYAVFHADCSFRGRWSLNSILKDEIIRRMQYPISQDTDVPWAGLYGYGEFAQLGGRNQFHMMTSSLLIMLKKE